MKRAYRVVAQHGNRDAGVVGVYPTREAAEAAAMRSGRTCQIRRELRTPEAYAQICKDHAARIARAQ